MVVVLPAPLGPRKATISPWRISRSMPRTAWTARRLGHASQADRASGRGPPDAAKRWVCSMTREWPTAGRRRTMTMSGPARRGARPPAPRQLSGEPVRRAPREATVYVGGVNIDGKCASDRFTHAVCSPARAAPSTSQGCTATSSISVGGHVAGLRRRTRRPAADRLPGAGVLHREQLLEAVRDVGRGQQPLGHRGGAVAERDQPEPGLVQPVARPVPRRRAAPGAANPAMTCCGGLLDGPVELRLGELAEQQLAGHARERRVVPGARSARSRRAAPRRTTAGGAGRGPDLDEPRHPAATGRTGSRSRRRRSPKGA